LTKALEMQLLRTSIPRLVFASILVLALCRGAAADGWKIQLQGAKALGASYAGRSVLTDDATVVWFNPAGMTALDGTWTLTAGAPLITYQLEFRDAGSRSLLGEPLLGETVQDGGTTAIVPHVYLVRRLNDRWRFGFGFNAPYGLGTNYDETWVGRYHATETRLSVFNLNPAVAVRLTEGLSVGFGFDLQYSDGTLANMIDFGSIGYALQVFPLKPQSFDGKVEFTGTDWASGFNAGVLWDLGKKTRLGAAYRSQIEHGLEGTADFTVPAAAAPLTAGGQLFADTPARAVLPMPHELSVSASQRLNEDWMLLGDVTWTKWSVFKELVVTFENPWQPPVEQAADWDDSLRVAVGASGRLDDRWTIRAGAAYETTPVPDATRTPRLPEDDHVWLSGAATYAGSDRWTIDFHFSHLITPDADINLPDATAGELTGTVHWRLNIVGVAATFRF
jgi:long-chain fatty acid transport protein